VTSFKQTQKDGPVRRKALRSCESAVLSALSEKEMDKLADQSLLFDMEEGQEMVLENEAVKYLYVVVRGFYSIYNSFKGDEYQIGSISGAGQVIGEMDFLQEAAEGQGPTHSVTVVASDATCQAVAIPVSNDLLRTHEATREVLKGYADRTKATLAALAARECVHASLLHSDHRRMLSDCSGLLSCDDNAELREQLQLLGAKSVVVVEGSVRVRWKEKTYRRMARRRSTVEAEGLTDVASVQPTSVRVEEVLTGGKAVEDYLLLTRAGIGQRSSSVRVIGGPALLLVVTHDDLEPLLWLHFQLRRHFYGDENPPWVVAEDLKGLGMDDLSLEGGPRLSSADGSQSRIRSVAVGGHLGRVRTMSGERNGEGPVDEEDEGEGGGPHGNLSRFPWWRNQERRAIITACCRRRAKDSWRFSQHDQEEQAEAPFFWNRTANVDSAPAEEWENLLSDAEVGVTFSSPQEATSAATSLEFLWKHRFATARLAGQTKSYHTMVDKMFIEIEQCNGDSAGAVHFEEEMEANGIIPDAKMAVALAKMYNRISPILIEAASKNMKRLVTSKSQDKTLLTETVEAWCACGHAAHAEDVLEECCKASVQVPHEAWTALVTGWIRLRDTAAALKALRNMWADRSTPAVGLLNTLLALFLLQNMIPEAMQVLEEMESTNEGEGAQPNETSYMLALSGLVSLGDGSEVHALVSRMLERLQEHPTPMLANFIVESWCLAGRTRRAQRFLDSLDSKSLCQVRLEDGTTCQCLTARNEESHAIVAAGWAAAGEGQRAAEAMVTMATLGFDPRKVDLNSIIVHWKQGKRRNTLGHEIVLPDLVGRPKRGPPFAPHKLIPDDPAQIPEGSPGARRRWGQSTDTPDASLSRPATRAPPTRERALAVGGRNAIHAELERQLFPPRKEGGRLESQKSLLDRQKSLLDRQKSREGSGELMNQGSKTSPRKAEKEKSAEVVLITPRQRHATLEKNFADHPLMQKHAPRG